MTKLHKTAQGLNINMEKLRLLHEKEIAVGNSGLNARGDQILKNGDVLVSRNERIKEYYKSKEQK